MMEIPLEDIHANPCKTLCTPSKSPLGPLTPPCNALIVTRTLRTASLVVALILVVP